MLGLSVHKWYISFCNPHARVIELKQRTLLLLLYEYTYQVSELSVLLLSCFEGVPRPSVILWYPCVVVNLGTVIMQMKPKIQFSARNSILRIYGWI